MKERPQADVTSVVMSNVTSLLPHLRTGVGWGADVVMLTETKLTAGAQKAVTSSLAKCYNAAFGPPVGLRRFKGQKRESIWDGQAGGVAVLTRKPGPAQALGDTYKHPRMV